MDKQEIRKTVESLLGDVIDRENIELADTTVADDIEDWDSLAHVKLILAIEDFYGIRFESDEIAAPENVGALVDLIAAKAVGK